MVVEEAGHISSATRWGGCEWITCHASRRMEGEREERERENTKRGKKKEKKIKSHMNHFTKGH